MPPCRHESLEFVGEQKTDDGANSYYRCRACGTLLIVMPSSKVVGVPGKQPDRATRADTNTS